jgi:Ribbon-helix-helix protein, copG family
VKKTSLYLDPQLDEALARRAAEEGVTKAELIRRTLSAAIQRPPRARLSVGVVRNGPGGVSAHVDLHLAETGFGAA